MRRAAWIALSGAAFLAVLGLLYVLIGNLATMELQPAAPAAAEAVEPAGPGPSPQFASEPRAVALIQIVLRILIILAGLVFVFGTLFSRSFRRDFLQRVLAAGITLIVMILFAVLLLQRAEIATSDAPPPGAAPGPTSAVASPADEAGSSRGVSIALVILAAATVATGGAWIATRLLGRRRRRPAPPDLLEEIAEVARTASRRLRDGDPVARVVLDCYSEMSHLVAREEHVPFDDYLTPREFSERLRTRGMESEHAARLTRIFEVVRYGGRSDARLASEAMACLTSVRDRYAAESP
ncbi:MAG: DUF4129 domain-containing protein [Candidatus Bipolaricaulota bacterium]|nr:MAG: DUF4129 domain-containing protein [Candidatus Bipolaricaulota bacterium]